MARTVTEIKAQIVANIKTRPRLAKIYQVISQVSIWGDLIHAIAVCIGVFEQLLDKHRSDVELIVSTNNAGSLAWLRQKLLVFQYDSTTPQIVVLNDNLIPQYQVVDATKRIITVVAIRAAGGLGYMIVAKNDPPEKLTTPEANALQSYLTDGGDNLNLPTGIGFAGIAYNITSLDPDLVRCKGTVYYKSQYSSTIQATVFAALLYYLWHLQIDGYIRTMDFINTVLKVEGVTGFIVEELQVRPAGGSYGGGYSIIASSAILHQTGPTDAAYAVAETTALHTWVDEITFTAT